MLTSRRVVPVFIGFFIGFIGALLASPRVAYAQCNPPAAPVKLHASDGAAGDRFGWQVAIDGSTAVVATTAEIDTGVVYVFVDGAGTWSQQARLVPAPSSADDSFGYSVGVSGDSVIVGAHQSDALATDSGAAFVFVRSGPTWTQQSVLPTPTRTFARIGWAVAIQGDRALVGAPRMDVGAGETGTAYAFTRTAGTWTLDATLTASDGAVRDFFGTSLAVDGDTAVVGAPEFNIGADSPGAAYVFVRSGGIWTEQAKLTPSDGVIGDLFGSSVAISGDTVLVGAPRHVADPDSEGAAYAFGRSGGTWSQEARLDGTDAPRISIEHFGSSVAVEGAIALVGESLAGPHFQGFADVFVRRSAAWYRLAPIYPAVDGPLTLIGNSVGLSGGMALIGAPLDDDVGNDAGAAYLQAVCREADCVDGADDDSDGAVDCDDSDCSIPTCSEDCADGFDNDADGIVDCGDADCFGTSCTEVCGDGFDNDADGLTDCADPDCFSSRCPEICGDGQDNDGDSRTDCADSSCFGPTCGEICDDNSDNDTDGLRDCLDPDCDGQPGPGGAPCEVGREATCGDGRDNDADGRTDCADTDCEGRPGPGGGACESRERSCDDAADNDGDRLVDCADRDCWGTASCECPGASFQPANDRYCQGTTLSACSLGNDIAWDWHPQEDRDGDGRPEDDVESVGCTVTPSWSEDIGVHSFCIISNGGMNITCFGDRFIVPRPLRPVPTAISACEGELVTLDCGIVESCAEYAWDLDVAVDSDGNGTLDDDADARGCRVLVALAAGTRATKVMADNPLAAPNASCDVSAPLTFDVLPAPSVAGASGTASCARTASSVDCGGAQAGVTYSWDFDVASDGDGNGVPDDDSDAAGCAASPTYERGRHVARVSAVTDATGCRSSRDVTLDVPGPQPPRPAISVACPGQPVALDCGVNEAGVTYTWDIDTAVDSSGNGDPADDADAVGCAVAQAYPTGTFTARVTADDGRCRAFEDAALVIDATGVPGEARDVKLLRTGCTITIAWRFAVGGSTYRVLRGDVLTLLSSRSYDSAADPANGRGECNVTGTSFSDPDDGCDGIARYYLVTAVNGCSGREGSTGFGWNGAPFERSPRTPTASCP